MKYRIAFNCDLFMTVEAGPSASIDDLERRVVARIGELAISNIALRVKGLDANIYPRVNVSGNLENFTIENEEEEFGG